MSARRVEPLDWQRGMLATSIMVFHLVTWEFQPIGAEHLLGRIGIYGVAMFFVLSGLSMAITYADSLRDVRSAGNFFIGRICRIWPLLWMAVLLVTANRLLTGKDPQWISAAMTATTAFAFVSPDKYVVAGAWSIGNEMVYYALTPLIVAVYHRRLALGNLLTAAAVSASLAYTGLCLTVEQNLQPQLAAYSHPLSNLFMYCAGVALYYNFRDARPSRTALNVLLLASLAAFFLTPARGNLIHLIAGPSRIVLSAASVGLVLYFYKYPFPSGRAWWSAALGRLGTVTYGVYLLHPIAYRFVRPVGHAGGPDLAPALTAVLTAGATFAMAFATYRYVESPFIRLGRRLSHR